jgi:hypothetical protein
VVAGAVSQPCHPGATAGVHAEGTAVRRDAVDRRGQQAAHAPTNAPWRGEGAESPLGFEHRVACGGPGGSPHATNRCAGRTSPPSTRTLGHWDSPFPPEASPSASPRAAPRPSDPIRGGGRSSRYDGPGSRSRASARRAWLVFGALTVRRASGRVSVPPRGPARALRQPKETLQRSNPSGTVLRATRHQRLRTGVCPVAP